MKPFAYRSPATLGEALSLLAEHGAGARVLAGGTDLLVELGTGPHAPTMVVDITRLGDLKRIAVADDGLRVGALATHSDIMRAAPVRELFPALCEAAHSIGAVQTRNLGTLGGNLVSGVPSMDSGPALLALDAEVVIASARGQRRQSLGDFFLGPRKTSLAPDELLIEVVVPRASFGKATAFLKFGLRKGQALALVNAAAAVALQDGRFVAPRIALGAVAPTVMRAQQAEAFLANRPASPETIAEAARIAASEAKPISDFRASAEYRRELMAVLTRRALQQACARAGLSGLEQAA
jgi:CO/xanthine dehydrogenase FAD-binding subunit